jgi:CBS domain-containing protein
MQVREIMNNKPRYIAPTTTLKEAAKEMLDRDIGFLPIGENDRLIGAITDRDIAIRGVAGGNGTSEMKVGDVMTKNVTYCFEDDPIEEAAKTMCKQQLRRLIVLNKDKRFTGILSVGDIARKGRDHKLSGQVLHDVCCE